MNLGSRLKQILEERGLTVTQFSKEADVPAQTLYALINRDSNKADMDILIKLLTALNMDFFTFMGADAPAGVKTEVPAKASDASASVKTAAPETGADASSASDRVVEKVVEKVVVKEVPAAAPAGKTALYVSSDTYEKILELAADEDITDQAVLAQAIEEYMALGFGYRQRPLRSILSDFKPKSKRSGDMDSFLL